MSTENNLKQIFKKAISCTRAIKTVKNKIARDNFSKKHNTLKRNEIIQFLDTMELN